MIEALNGGAFACLFMGLIFGTMIGGDEGNCIIRVTQSIALMVILVVLQFG
jgi:hypothetical protein